MLFICSHVKKKTSKCKYCKQGFSTNYCHNCVFYNIFEA